MNPLTIEWIEKAEGDFTTMRRELRARSAPNYDAVCFHAQQCAEKYLKAILHEHGQGVPRTHSLLELLALLLKLDPTFQLIQVDLNVLEGNAVLYRYPGQSAHKQEGQEASRAAEAVRKLTRLKLGLP